MIRMTRADALMVVAFLGSMTAVLASGIGYIDRYSPAREMKQEALTHLQEIILQQNAYFQENQTYARSLEELQLPSRKSGWTFSTVVRSQGEGIGILAIAFRGQRALMFDETFNFGEFELEDLPEMPAWKVEKRKPESPRESSEGVKKAREAAIQLREKSKKEAGMPDKNNQASSRNL